MLPPAQRRNASVRGGDCHVMPERFMRQCSAGAEAVAPTAAATKGSFAAPRIVAASKGDTALPNKSF